MPIIHTNAKGQTFTLHQGTTKTGKPKYYFAMQGEGTLFRRVGPFRKVNVAQTQPVRSLRERAMVKVA